MSLHLKREAAPFVMIYQLYETLYYQFRHHKTHDVDYVPRFENRYRIVFLTSRPFQC